MSPAKLGQELCASKSPRTPHQSTNTRRNSGQQQGQGAGRGGGGASGDSDDTDTALEGDTDTAPRTPEPTFHNEPRYTNPAPAPGPPPDTPKKEPRSSPVKVTFYFQMIILTLTCSVSRASPTRC